MRAALALVLALAASPVEAKPWQCVLWPKTCQLDEPAEIPPLETLPTPPPAPPVVVPPVPAPVPKAPAPKAPPVVTAAPPPVKAKPRIKSTWQKPKKQVAVQANWCAQVPSWATLDVIVAAASARGVTMTEAQKSQARACIASKRTP